MKNFKLFILMIAIVAISCSKESQFDETKRTKDEAKLITLKSGVIVEQKGDNFILEGDILLSDNQLEALDKKGTIFINAPDKLEPITSLFPTTNLPLTPSTSKALGLYPTPYNLWAMVRFTYNSNLTSYMKSKIKEALLNIEARTNARFYNATGQPTKDPTYGFDYPYVDFTYTGNNDVSSSYVGRIGGRQQLSLADFAFYSWNTAVIEHEICHAIGMLHEQSRNDRDSYVTINWSNLTSSGSSQFSKRTTNYYMIGSYDYNSLMGYSSYTSSTSIVLNPTLPMYTKKDGSSIEQGDTVSNLDRNWINTLYLPYIARSDVYRELADIVYKPDNTIMTSAERLALQAQLNDGNPNPPSGGRIPNEF